MKDWIRICITTLRYSIAFNGGLIGYFPGKKGLSQGDPISPYLFVMGMELLSRLMHKAVMKGFLYHPRFEAIQLTHLCFADVIMIFNSTKASSIRTVKDVLLEFKDFSGLYANASKSEVFFGGSSDKEKQKVLEILNYKEGTLAVRYLGVPLVSGKLSQKDCKPLIDRIVAKIKSWSAKHLSFAGRLQLIKLVLFSVQVYWTSTFILPKKVIKTIEQKFSAFLWKGMDSKAYGAKVAWKDICVPKNEGGLGLKRTVEWEPSSCHDYMESFCKIWINLGCLGQKTVFENIKLLDGCLLPTVAVGLKEDSWVKKCC